MHLPSVSRAKKEGDADGTFVGDIDADGAADGVADETADGTADADGVADGTADTDGAADGIADVDGATDADGVADGTIDTDGVADSTDNNVTDSLPPPLKATPTPIARPEVAKKRRRAQRCTLHWRQNSSSTGSMISATTKS
jgi:hypothetical protein